VFGGGGKTSPKRGKTINALSLSAQINYQWKSRAGWRVEEEGRRIVVKWFVKPKKPLNNYLLLLFSSAMCRFINKTSHRSLFRINLRDETTRVRQLLRCRTGKTLREREENSERAEKLRSLGVCIETDCNRICSRCAKSVSSKRSSDLKVKTERSSSPCEI
jgi:hypothetical protein